MDNVNHLVALINHNSTLELIESTSSIWSLSSFLLFVNIDINFNIHRQL